MKVYVLEYITIFQGSQDTDIHVYQDLKIAKHKLYEAVEEAKETYWRFEYEETNYDYKKDMSYEIWRICDYEQNRISIFLHEKEVE